MAVSPLAALIQECQRAFEERHGVPLSYSDISRRSGKRVGRSRVQKIVAGPIRDLPTTETIKGLALGLGVPESVVLQRALASAGYTVPEDWHTGMPKAQTYDGGEATVADMLDDAREIRDKLDQDARVDEPEHNGRRRRRCATG